MKAITIYLPDSAICGQFVYVNITKTNATLDSFGVPNIQDGGRYSFKGFEVEEENNGRDKNKD